MAMQYTPLIGYGLNLHNLKDELKLKPIEVAKHYVENKIELLDNLSIISKSAAQSIKSDKLADLGMEIIDGLGVSSILMDLFDDSDIYTIFDEEIAYIMYHAAMPWDYSDNMKNITEEELKDMFLKDLYVFIEETNEHREKLDYISDVTFG